MAKKVPSILEIDLKKNGGKISFASTTEINDWINNQFNFYAWMDQARSKHSNVQYIWEQFVNRINQLRTPISQIQSSPSLESTYLVQFKDLIEITYQNNLLTELKNNTNTERTLFYYDSNNRVNKTDYYESGFLTTEFYQYDGNGNVIQSNDNYSTFQYTYNTLNNPFKNVFPQIDAEVSWYWFGSLVNNQTIVKEKLSTSTTFTTKYTYTYETNSSNYPTKRIQRNLSGNITETVTYEY